MRDKRTLVRALYEAVQAGRNLRAEARIPSNKKARFILRPTESGKIRPELPTLARLLNAEEVALDQGYKSTPADSVSVTSLGELILPSAVHDAGAERDRLQKEIARVEDELTTVRAKLGNQSFVDRAPQAVVDEHRQREKNFDEQLQKLREALKGLG